MMTTLNRGSIPIAVALSPGAVTSMLVAVDGADRGPCVPSFDPPFEGLDILWSAHVDSSGVVRVVIRNESADELSLTATLHVLNIEVACAP